MPTPPREDIEIGIEVYVLQTPGCGGRIRTSLDDFIVEEVLKPDAMRASEGRGGPDKAWSYFILEKLDITTIDAVAWLERRLGSPIRYLGLKDKGAMARQYLAIKCDDPPARLESPDGRVRLLYIGGGSEPLARRQLLGNRFRVRIRGADLAVAEAVIPRFVEEVKSNALANFYGHQRFGLRGPGSHRIGEAIVKRRFGEAVELLAGRARDPYSYEGKVAAYIEANPGRYVDALRRVPLRIRRLFVQAYQSYLFNRTLSLAIRRGEPLSQVRSGDVYAIFNPETGISRPIARALNSEGNQGVKVPLVPLAGYAVGLSKGRWESLLSEILEEEGVRHSDFYIKELQELSVEGGFRPAPLIVSDLACSVQLDTIELSFTLFRGSYATILLRELMKPMDYVRAGF